MECPYNSFPSLTCAIADADAISDRLRKLGFPESNICVLKNSMKPRERADLKNIRFQFDGFLRQLTPDSLVFFSFAGHGMEENGVSYLVPEDGENKNLSETAIPVNWIVDQLNCSHARVKIMLVDACRSRTRGNGKGVTLKNPPRGMAVLQSCSSDEIAWEDQKNHHGFFTQAFLEALDGKADANQDGEVTVSEIFEYTQTQTTERAGNVSGELQRPVYTCNGDVSNYAMLNLLVDGLTKEQRNEAEALYQNAHQAFLDRNLQEALTEIDAALGIYAHNEQYQQEKTLITNALKAEEALKNAQERQQSSDELARQEAEKKTRELTAQIEALRKAKEEAERNSRVSVSGSGTTLPASSKPAAGTRKVFTVDGIEYAFRWCPPGEFMMGSTDGDSDEKPVHKVRLTRGFWLMETEVTQEMWESVMGSNPSEFKDSRNPVEQVSWDDCQEFCRKLGQKLGQQVQLPTEAQWEYACRAGTTGAYAGSLDEMGWYRENSGSETHAVGLKKPNAWGLYDMHGNVWEWCSDWYDEDYYTASPTSDPIGPTSGALRVCRGGGWSDFAGGCRSADRSWCHPEVRGNDLGLRAALVPVQ